MRFFLILLLFVNLSASAQEPLSLVECINEAIAQSQALKIEAQKFAILTSELEVVKTQYLPSLGATASADVNSNNLATSTLRNYGFDAGVTLTQKLWSGGRINSAKRAAELRITIQDEQNIRALQGVEYSASVEYWGVAVNMEYLEIAERYCRIVEALCRVVEVRYADGYISKGDLLMVRAQLSEAQQGVIVARRLYSNALSVLNSRLGRMESCEYVLSDTLCVPDSLPLFAEFEEVLSLRADYRGALNEVDLARENVRVARSGFNPELWLTVGGNYGTPVPNLVDNATDFYGVARVNFAATIFEFGRRGKSVGQAEGMVEVAELEFLSLEQDVYRELEVAVNNVERTYEECLMWRGNLDISEQSLGLSMYRYEQGAIPLTDVLSAQIMWLTSYRSSVGAQYSYAVSLSELNYVSGTIN